MAIALSLPLMIAALLLIVAGVAKLWAPGSAASAVRAPRWSVRGFAAFELVLGGYAVLDGGTTAATVIALLYAGFAALTVRLSREGEACGCFGSAENPASPVQSALSGVVAITCAGAAVADAHGAGWVLSQPPGAVLLLGTAAAGAVYALVLAYTELPGVWRAWSPA